jgi:PAS domain S-box-containing protein
MSAGDSRVVRVSTWPVFAGLTLALTLLLAGVFVMHFYIDFRADRASRDADEMLNVELGRRAVAADIAAVTTDLLFLRSLVESLSFDPSVAEGRRRYMAEVFLTFAREKGLYDQIRFIDPAGREVVRVNYADGHPVLVDTVALQDKSDRYYVDRGLRLERGQVYLSPLDLNVEDGGIEQPVKPVLRFVAPVFDEAGDRRGLVVLNYLGDRLLESFRRATANIADHVQLLNGQGYWLSSPRPAEAWGFMFGRKDTFGRRYPGVWRNISSEQSGQLVVPGGLFTFATIWPAAEAARLLPPGSLPTAEGELWKVVSQVQLDGAALGLRDFFARHAVLYLGIIGLLAGLAYLLANAHIHRRAAEMQRAHEQRFRQTLEDIGLAAVMVDLKGRLTFCNRFLLELTGWRRDEVIGTDWVARFVPEDQRAGVNHVLARLGRDGDIPAEFEGEVCTRDGVRHLIAWTNTLVRDAEGQPLGLTAIGADITARRRAEEEVRKLSQAVEQSSAIVLITDRDGRIEYANPEFTEVTGYTFEEVRGRNPRLLQSGETPREEYRRLWRALTEGGEWRGEFHNRRKDGSLYWESAVISALRDAEGTITHFLAVKEDVTERKRLEKEVDVRNRELAHAQTLAAMGRMATMLAHDLRNPLSSVKMTVQILGKQTESQEARELAAIGQEQVHYMEDIITDMLTYSRPGELNTSWLGAEHLLTGMINTVRRRIADSGAEVSVDCAPGLPTFPGDASKLRQLLSNLLVNALQAVASRAEDDRRVRVTADLVMERGERRLRISICDNGEGIDLGIRDRLFEPFFTTRAKGTGLGLAIVRQITGLHGGAVALKENPGGGTCAVLTLPMTPAGAAEPSAPDDDRLKEGVSA